MKNRNQIVVVLCFLSTGCGTPLPRGGGLYRYVKEPSTGAKYHLYYPADYIKNNGRHPDFPRTKKWPLVMTFRGMGQNNDALTQEREWERQADFYGYIVCAPELKTFSSFTEYPLDHERNYVIADKYSVIAIMNHVFETTLAHPDRVLSTGRATGGYLAHYFPNRFPARFHCIAARQANFSSELMNDDGVSYYRERVPVAVFVGDGDTFLQKQESEEAVAWYRSKGFWSITRMQIGEAANNLDPELAARFFWERVVTNDTSQATLVSDGTGQFQCDWPSPETSDGARSEFVAVVDFNVSPDLSINSGEYLAELSRRMVLDSKQVVLVNRENMRLLLGEEDFSSVVECENERCLVDYGKKLKVQKLVYGSVTKLDRTLGLSIKIIDVETGETLDMCTRRVTGGLDELASAVGPETCALLRRVFLKRP